MKRKTIWITLAAVLMCAVAIFAAITNDARSIPSTGPLLTKAEAVSRAMSYFNQDQAPQLVDARLLYHQDANALFGVFLNYENPEYPYTPQTPVWVVTLAAGDLSNMPMFGEGNYAGVTLLMTAPDGNVESYGALLSTVPEEDPYLGQILAMDDLDGKVKIEHAPPTKEPGEPPPTSTPVPVTPIPVSSGASQ
jgi:hypothetical protein